MLEKVERHTSEAVELVQLGVALHNSAVLAVIEACFLVVCACAVGMLLALRAYEKQQTQRRAFNAEDVHWRASTLDTTTHAPTPSTSAWASPAAEMLNRSEPLSVNPANAILRPVHAEEAQEEVTAARHQGSALALRRGCGGDAPSGGRDETRADGARVVR
jgi:hypothetical protein